MKITHYIVCLMLPLLVVNGNSAQFVNNVIQENKIKSNNIIEFNYQDFIINNAKIKEYARSLLDHKYYKSKEQYYMLFHLSNSDRPLLNISKDHLATLNLNFHDSEFQAIRNINNLKKKIINTVNNYSRQNIDNQQVQKLMSIVTQINDGSFTEDMYNTLVQMKFIKVKTEYKLSKFEEFLGITKSFEQIAYDLKNAKNYYEQFKIIAEFYDIVSNCNNIQQIFSNPVQAHDVLEPINYILDIINNCPPITIPYEILYYNDILDLIERALIQGKLYRITYTGYAADKSYFFEVYKQYINKFLKKYSIKKMDDYEYWNKCAGNVNQLLANLDHIISYNANDKQLNLLYKLKYFIELNRKNLYSETNIAEMLMHDIDKAFNSAYHYQRQFENLNEQVFELFIDLLDQNQNVREKTKIINSFFNDVLFYNTNLLKILRSNNKKLRDSVVKIFNHKDVQQCFINKKIAISNLFKGIGSEAKNEIKNNYTRNVTKLLIEKLNKKYYDYCSMLNKITKLDIKHLDNNTMKYYFKTLENAFENEKKLFNNDPIGYYLNN